MKIKDSGKRSKFSTGAVRDGETGKGRFDLLPVTALTRVAQHFENGALKYAERNWERGIPLHRFWDSGIRHAMKWLRGDRDEDHLAAAAWNFLCLIETDDRIRRGVLPAELNTVPHNEIPDVLRNRPGNKRRPTRVPRNRSNRGRAR